MNILLLTVTDQQQHPMGKYVDLHRTYDFNNWITGFSSLPYKVFNFDYYKSFVNNGPFKTEKEIFELTESLSINLVIIPNIYYEISLHFLRKLRSKNIKSVLVFFDDSSRFESTNRFYIGMCDYVVTHESRHALKLYEPYNCHVSFFPCYPSVLFYDKVLDNAKSGLSALGDVTFVGANIADRSEFISSLAKAGFQLSIFGNGWSVGRLSQEDMLLVFRDSKISLNFTKSGDQTRLKQLKARSFEIVLAGGFLLTEYDEELCNYFEVGKEIDMFSSIEECESKVRFYLNNADVRMQMQQRAIIKCRSQLNFETAWSTYLDNLSCNSSPLEKVQARGELPNIAIKSYILWNMQLIKGRLKIRQLYLAYRQLVYCLRDLSFLSHIYKHRVWLIPVHLLLSTSLRLLKLKRLFNGGG